MCINRSVAGYGGPIFHAHVLLGPGHGQVLPLKLNFDEIIY